MIALIALAALCMVFGVLVGAIALIIVTAKTIVRSCRNRSRPVPRDAPIYPDGCSTVEDQEFLRIVQTEWPGTP